MSSSTRLANGKAKGKGGEGGNDTAPYRSCDPFVSGYLPVSFEPFDDLAPSDHHLLLAMSREDVRVMEQPECCTGEWDPPPFHIALRALKS
jgi:hypothetical protein